MTLDILHIKKREIKDILAVYPMQIRIVGASAGGFFMCFCWEICSDLDLMQSDMIQGRITMRCDIPACRARRKKKKGRQ